MLDQLRDFVLYGIGFVAAACIGVALLSFVASLFLRVGYDI